MTYDNSIIIALIMRAQYCESTRLPPMWPGFDSRTGRGDICGLSLLLVLVLAPRGFSLGSPVFAILKQLLQIPIQPGEFPHSVKRI